MLKWKGLRRVVVEMAHDGRVAVVYLVNELNHCRLPCKGIYSSQNCSSLLVPCSLAWQTWNIARLVTLAFANVCCAAMADWAIYAVGLISLVILRLCVYLVADT